jgi:hypothetical protein
MKTQWEYDLVEKPFCEQLKDALSGDSARFLVFGMGSLRSL